MLVTPGSERVNKDCTVKNNIIISIIDLFSFSFLFFSQQTTIQLTQETIHYQDACHQFCLLQRSLLQTAAKLALSIAWIVVTAGAQAI